jgi:hypothetical protein
MQTHLLKLTVLATAIYAGVVVQSPGEAVLGYTDTPMLPSGNWHVHDPNRPVPPVVKPGATFSDGAAPPSDAVILFNGAGLSHWKCEKGPVKWTVQRGYMEVAPHTGDIETKETFGDFQLHLEWAEPEKVEGNSQERGNSGVFLQGLYEVQVLDSYNNPTYPDGQCGGLYGQSPPLANACRKPGAWQTYDIIFEAARFGPDHVLIRPASATVIQNGVVLHHKQALLGPTGHKILADYKKDIPARGPIKLQDHGNPVRFRNIWIREIAEEEKP